MLRHSSFGFWLVAAAVALRLIVAPGFMPVAVQGGFEIRICGQPGMTIPVPGKPDAPMPRQGECAFAALSAAATCDAPVAFACAAPLAPVETPRPAFARSPHVGVPAPPPPPIGPPAFA